MRELPPALAALAAYRQFLCYVLVPSKSKPGKFDKLPVSPHTGEVCTAHDPTHWTDAAHACKCATAWGDRYGVAFSFQESDPFWFVDVDNCRDAAGQWSPLAQQVAAMFPGAAMEVSQSGNGLHIIGMGRAPAHGCKNVALGMEFYTELRFVALTGAGAVGDAGTDHTAALQALTAQYFPAGAGTGAGGDFTLSDRPVPEWRGPVDDADLIRRALASKSAASAFGGRASFADLWNADADALGKAYPDQGGRAYDASSADAALASHLAFWTGRHGERMQRLMLQSGLVRDKWEREDYLPRTIAEILAKPGQVCQDKPTEPVASAPAPSEGAEPMRAVEGATFLGVAQQMDFFKGCVYVLDRHRALVPGGSLLRPEQFRAYFGGYAFAMDNVNERTTRNAWEAFTESQGFRAPRADSICFRPDLPAGAFFDDGGKRRVNAFWPPVIKRTPGDPSRFLAHLAKMLPNERDRAILLSYMAACVQYPGVKFSWAPVVQGAEGNGKTMLSIIVAEAVGRLYTHWTDADGILSKFNGWIADKLFIGVEEMKGQEHRAEETVEALKTMITGGYGIRVEYKGVDQTTMPIVANFMLTTNFKNSVRKTGENNRRLAVFYCAQQTKADIDAAGMGGEYFPRLWDWLRAEGFAILNHYLATYPIAEEFNPATLAHRAPDTSMAAEIIRESRGSVEQHIAEVIAQETPGFMGGWVSSVALDRLLTETLRIGSKLTHSKRREIMQGMGYILHPWLMDGRVNNPVAPDNRRTQLFIQRDHPAASLKVPGEIAKAYSAAQQVRAAG